MDDHAHDPNGSDAAGHGGEGEQFCDDAIAQLYAYLDGELDDSTIARIEEHLQRCSPCLEAYDFEAELRKVIAAKAREDCPGEVRNRIMALLERLDGGDDDAVGPADRTSV